MAGLTQVDWKSLANEANIRVLLEDLIEYYKGVYPGQRLALAVWFGKTPQGTDHNLLALFTGPPMRSIAQSERQSLLWKTGSAEPPFANIHATSIDHFAHKLASDPRSLTPYFDKPEVLYFDKDHLPAEILQAFKVITEPSGLIKGWYIPPQEYSKFRSVRELLAGRSLVRPTMGIVKTWESDSLDTCRALVHAEFSQRWLPLSEGGLRAYTYYNDWQDGRPVHFLFQGGSLYQVDRFEVKTAPEYSKLVLDRLPDDRYPEVYLRAVPSRQEPAA